MLLSLLKLCPTIVAAGSATATIAYIFSDQLLSLTGLNTKPTIFNNPDDGFKTIITNIAVKNNKKLIHNLPAKLALTPSKKSYICRASLEINKVLKTFDDHTCSLYKLPNFELEGSHTFNIPLIPLNSDLHKTKQDLFTSKHQLLKVNTKFYEMFAGKTPNILLVDKISGLTTFLELTPIFIYQPLKDHQKRSNLFNVRLKRSNPTKTYNEPFTQKNSYLCQISPNPTKLPCSLYKYQYPLYINNLTPSLLTNLTHIKEPLKDLIPETYYVLDLFNHIKSLDDLANKEIYIYVSGIKHTLIYDQHLFGIFSKSLNNPIYPETPKLREFLVLKTPFNPLASLGLTQPLTNYTCKLAGIPSPTDPTLHNYDDSCTLSDIPPKESSSQQHIDISGNALNNTNPTTYQSLIDNTYFKLSLNPNKLFNLDVAKEIKIQLIPKATSKYTSPIEFTLLQEWNSIDKTLEGPIRYLLVQAWTSWAFNSLNPENIKCKFLGGQPFNCDLYRPTTPQTKPYPPINSTDNLTTLDLGTLTKEDFSINKPLKQRQYFLIHLKKPFSLKHIKNRKPFIYIYNSLEDIDPTLDSSTKHTYGAFSIIKLIETPSPTSNNFLFLT